MPRLADALDTELSRLTRALGALEDPALAAALESALLRAGRLEDAYLLRWRRGEPSPVAAAVAERQRPALAALDADPGVQRVPCPTCGPLGCGSGLEVGVGPRGAPRWLPLGAGAVIDDDSPIVAATGVRRPEELAALGALGTLVEVEVSSDALAAPLPPTIEAVEVRVTHGDLPPERLAGLDRLQALVVRGRLTDEGLERLLAGCGGRLERLQVSASLLTDVGLEAALTRAPRLRALALADAPWLDGSGLRALADVGAPLERFTLREAPRSTWRTLDAVGALATAEEVDLDDVPLGEDGLAPLAELPRLRRLALRGASAAAGGLDALIDTPITALDLDRPGLDDAALDLLGRLPELRQLTARAPGRVTRAGWAALARAPRLERLTLLRCGPEPDPLLELCRSSSLVRLTLEASEVGSPTEVGAALARACGLERLSLLCGFAGPILLEALSLGRSGVRDLTLDGWGPPARPELLRPVACLPRLERLAIHQVEPGAIASLAPAPELQELALRWAPRLDDADVAALRSCLTLRLLRIGCDEPTRERLALALRGVEVLAFDPRSWVGEG